VKKSIALIPMEIVEEADEVNTTHAELNWYMAYVTH
jgi:hypothetical protein